MRWQQAGQSRSSHARLALEQRALAAYAPAIAAERAVATDHTVTGDRDRQHVGRDRAGNRAHRPGPPQAARDVAVAHGGAGAALAQGLPDAVLKSGAAQR